MKNKNKILNLDDYKKEFPKIIFLRYQDTIYFDELLKSSYSFADLLEKSNKILNEINIKFPNIKNEDIIFNFVQCYDHNDDISGVKSLNISVKDEETDEEYEERVKTQFKYYLKDKEREQKEKERKKQDKIKIEELEWETYLKLKSKFSNKEKKDIDDVSK